MATFVAADDSTRQRDVLIRILRDEGHKVLAVCEDGDDAIKLCDKLMPDVVLLDVSMRRMNGDTAAQKIREKHPDMHIIVVSSLVQGAVARPLIAGGIDFISKPYSAGQFLNNLKRIMSSWSEPQKSDLTPNS